MQREGLGMKRMALVAAIACLAACSPKAPAPAPQAPAAAQACSAEAGIDWAPVAGPAYHIAAAASGATCKTATATLTITAPDGKTAYSGTHQIEPMVTTVFADADTPQALAAALQHWIDPTTGSASSTAKLPDWPRGANGPVAGEFPFYPQEGMTRDAWLRLRAQDRPLFCFVQGSESEACLMLDPEHATLTPIGVQTFPG